MWLDANTASTVAFTIPAWQFWQLDAVVPTCCWCVFAFAAPAPPLK